MESAIRKNGRATIFAEEEKDFWTNNHEEFLKYGQEVEMDLNGIIDLLIKDSEAQKNARMETTEAMRKKLATKPGLAEILIPDFTIWL